MREQKYRAWNKEHDFFFYFLNGKYYNSEDCNHCISERICFEFQWSNAEQYTGLKDKNGKDIYEGDIVRCYYEDDIPEDYDDHTVIWCGEDYPAFDLKPSVDVDNNGLSYYKAAGVIEIISNIHESNKLNE